MRIKQAGSFNSGGTPTLEAFTPRHSATWTPSVKATRTYPEGKAPGACFTYITQPDGSVIKLPFITPRAERKQRATKQAVQRNTTRLDRSEAARLAPVDHDYNDQ